MLHLTGITVLCDGRAVRAVVHATISGAHDRHRAQQPGPRWARSARRTSLRRLPDTPVSRGAERADPTHQMGHYQRTLV